MMWGKLLVCEVYALTLPQYPSFGRLVPDRLSNEFHTLVILLFNNTQYIAWTEGCRVCFALYGE